MSRALYLAAFLFAPYRSIPRTVRNQDGSVDESMMFTPGMMVTLERFLYPKQRDYLASEPRRRAHVRGRRIG